MGRQEKAFSIIVLCGILGIIMSIILQMMYTDELIVNELIEGTITLRVIQAVTILFWTMGGIVLSAKST